MTRILLPALVLSLCLAGCRTRRTVVVQHHDGSHTTRTIVVKHGPPAAPKVVMVKGAQPGAHHVWVQGHYVWRHGRYAWVKGHWIVPPQRGAVWVPGHWARTRDGGVWVAGHWR